MVEMLAEAIMIKRMTELISTKYKLTLDEARDKVFSSEYIKLLHDERSGLVSESPFYNLEIYEDIEKDSKK